MLWEKPLSAISVRELCSKADINRSTFYDHYADLCDFCNCLEQETIEQTMRYMEKRVRRTNQEDALTELLVYIQNNANLFLTLLHRSGGFARRIEENVYQIYAEYYSGIGREFTEADKYRIEFNTAGAIRVIQSWLLKENKQTPSEVAKMCFSLSGKE